MKPQYLYRLNVTYPLTLLGNAPDTPAAQAWMAEAENSAHPEDGAEWVWPSAGPYRSRSGAVRRAELLRSYGCTVSIQRSNPITWPDDPVLAPSYQSRGAA